MSATRFALALISTSLAAFGAAHATPLVDLQSPAPLTLGEVADGDIAEGISLHEAPCAATGGAERAFALTVESFSAVGLFAEAEFEPVLTVYADGEAVACGVGAIDVELSPGTYTVVVEGADGATGPFSLESHGEPLEPTFAQLADPPAPVEGFEEAPFEDAPVIIDDPIEAAHGVHTHEGEECATGRYGAIMQAAEAQGVAGEVFELLYAEALEMEATAIDLFEGDDWAVEIPNEGQWGPLEEAPAPDYATSTHALTRSRSNLYKSCPAGLSDRDKTFVFDTPQGNFRLHYKVCGADRVPEAWRDTANSFNLPDGTRATLNTGNAYTRTNAPDSVERVGAYMEYGRARFTGHGMKVHNERLNVYIHDAPDYCGLHTWNLFAHHFDINTGCMGMSTPVHEVFHEVQSRHGIWQNNLGTFAQAAIESGARYSQTLVGAHGFDGATAYSRDGEFPSSLSASAALTRYFGLFYGYLTEQYATASTTSAVGFGGDGMNELLRAFESNGWHYNGFLRFLSSKSTTMEGFVRSFYLQLVTQRFGHLPANLPIANGLKRDFAYRRAFDLDARVVNELADCIQFSLNGGGVTPGKKGMQRDTTTQCITDHQRLVGPYGGTVGRFELEPLTLPNGRKIILSPDEIAVDMQMYPSDSIRAVYNFGDTRHLPDLVDGWLLEAGAEQANRSNNHIHAAHEVDPFVKYFSPSDSARMIIDDSRQKMILRPHADTRSLYFVFTHAHSRSPYQGARRRVRIAVTPTWADTDRDGFPDRADNCPYDANVSQSDADGDGVGDACDVCPSTGDAHQRDGDGDGIGDACDLCPSNYGGDTDADGDGVGDVCDVCPSVSDSSQTDSDGDGRGDACDACPSDYDFTSSDYDRDGIPDACDNCAFTANADQRDRDGNDIGDACEYLTAVSVANGTPAMCLKPGPPQILPPSFSGWYSADSGRWTLNSSPLNITLGAGQVPQFDLRFDELAANLIDVEFSYCAAGQCAQGTTPWFTHTVRQADWTIQGNNRGEYQAHIDAPCLPGNPFAYPTLFPSCSHMPGDAFEVYAEWVFYPGAIRRRVKLANVSIVAQSGECLLPLDEQGPVFWP